jgi:hypothetical protein
MTHEELFSIWPRPWRLSEEDVGVVLDANGIEVLTVDTNNDHADVDVVALAELLVELGNETEE